MTRTVAAVALGLMTLTACEETMTTDRVNSGLPSPAQSNCMAAVADEAGNLNVTVLAAGASQGGSEVVIGVGEDRAPWRCLADRDGNVEQVTALGNGGGL